MDFWWEKIFGNARVYSLLEGGPSASMAQKQMDFIAQAINLKDEMCILDCGCGRGWLSHGLARKGARVTGIDSSALMADQCPRLASDAPSFTFRQMDFRTISFVAEYDAAICWGNTLGYATRQDDLDLIKRLVRALVPGGGILIDLHNSSWYRAHALGKSWRETQNEYLLSDTIYEPNDRRFVSKRIIIPKNGEVPEEYTYRILHYEPTEIQQILESMGVAGVVFYGDACASKTGPLFSSEGWNERSHVMIVSGRKGTAANDIGS